MALKRKGLDCEFLKGNPGSRYLPVRLNNIGSSNYTKSALEGEKGPITS